MRIAYAIPAFALLAATGCNERDLVPAYVSTSYQVRCLDECTSAQDDEVREIFHLDGETGFRVTCAVGTNSAGDRRLSFSAQCSGDDGCGDDSYGIEVSGLALDSKDGNPSQDCRVRVKEGPNTYQGACRKGDPSSSQRCSVEFSVNAADSLVRGKLLCANVADRNAPSFTRYVVSPGGGEESRLSFTVQGCEGLE